MPNQFHSMENDFKSIYIFYIYVCFYYQFIIWCAIVCVVCALCYLIYRLSFRMNTIFTGIKFVICVQNACKSHISKLICMKFDSYAQQLLLPSYVFVYAFSIRIFILNSDCVCVFFFLSCSIWWLAFFFAFSFFIPIIWFLHFIFLFRTT